MTDQEMENFDEKRSEAMQAFSEGEWDKAMGLFTEAIKLNPNSAAMFAKRGTCFLKLSPPAPRACVRDCSRAKKLAEHQRKKERKAAERELKERQERVKKAKEAREKAAKEQQDQEPDMGGMGGGGMGGLGGLFNDPEMMAAFSDPEVAAAFKDISSNPANIMKYQNNPKVMALVNKMASKMGGMGGMRGGAGAGAGSAAGAGPTPPPPSGASKPPTS